MIYINNIKNSRSALYVVKIRSLSTCRSAFY